MVVNIFEKNMIFGVIGCLFSVLNNYVEKVLVKINIVLKNKILVDEKY